jgi:hypothetical protein
MASLILSAASLVSATRSSWLHDQKYLENPKIKIGSKRSISVFLYFTSTGSTNIILLRPQENKLATASLARPPLMTVLNVYHNPINLLLEVYFTKLV